MKYMLLIYQNPTAWAGLSTDEQNAMMSEAGSIFTQLQNSGELVGGAGLAAPKESKGVRLRDGVPVITDGPYIEAKEQLAGYVTVDVASLDRALEIAAGWPDARLWGMEVREVIGG